MKRSLCQFLVASSLLLCGGGVSLPTRSQGPARTTLRIARASYALAAMRPRYGGTVRVEMQARVASLDPSRRSDDFDANRVRALIYDHLVLLDAHAQPQPALALSWKHDSNNTKWEFKLRSGVKWHDGSPLTPADVAKAVERMMSGRLLRVVGDIVEIETGDPWPDLPQALATDPASVILRALPGLTDEAPMGSGPFRIAEWRPGQRVVLQANEDYWGGRPYLDGIQFEMGRSSREQWIDLQLGKADLIELGPAEARRAQQEGRRVWASAPLDLLSLEFDVGKPGARDQRLRQAIALSIDRSAIQKALLQNYGEVAGGIFPQWLSGYEFLFSPALDLGRARQLRAELAARPSLTLGFDSTDALSRQVAERVAVNARDVGVTIQVSPLLQGWRSMADRGVDAIVKRTRIDGPALEQASSEASTGIGFMVGALQPSTEQVYAAERRFLDGFHTVPLVRVPEIVGLGPRVRNWSAFRWGDWRLEDVWVESD